MANEELLLATIDAKLSALLEAAVDNQAHGIGGRPGDAAHEDGTEDEAAARARSHESGGLGQQNGTTAPAAAPAPAPARVTGEDLAVTLEEIARLLALSLRRKRDFAEVVAELDAVGFDRARIGELLGESPSRVDAALVAYDRRAGKQSRSRSRR